MVLSAWRITDLARCRARVWDYDSGAQHLDHPQEEYRIGASGSSAGDVPHTGSRKTKAQVAPRPNAGPGRVAAARRTQASAERSWRRLPTTSIVADPTPCLLHGDGAAEEHHRGVNAGANRPNAYGESRASHARTKNRAGIEDPTGRVQKPA